MTALSVVLGLAIAATGAPAGDAQRPAASSAETARPGGFVLEHEAELVHHEPGPHDGLGQTSGYRFFEQVPGVPFSFRKRVLHRGASIGYHRQTEDEVYYVVSGTGRMTIDGKTFAVKAGDATLTRPGSSHGLVQVGHDDLVLVIVFPLPVAAPPAAAR
jgi:mannose-6-phosphate isomerase-like protein (cupin superfamily)